ncbi:hypothetical protein K505DRAFT_230062 [Melanomma pulvis-pyrius CBS 109.77]|uniref:Peptidase S54 rhomboid domain-containing protein n=1 Tax=Melanomma pulvis-pyrius CBS 109.77 TaxID=1314802 RepID=A0A6A6XU00_9PLEO|nr:hypothetical protein K505DRAFT_230062 [Melanomma pulvis-pyrius CBS 109.77]
MRNIRTPQSSQHGKIPNKIYFPEKEAQQERLDEEGLPYAKVLYLQPAIWAIGVSTGIYILLAFLEAKSQLAPATSQQHHDRHLQSSPPGPIELATRVWAQQYPVEKVAFGLIATNGAVHLTSFLTPHFWRMLWHAPATNLNITMFTSTFVHDGPIHLLVNMWACYNFLPAAGSSHLFEGNAYHTLAFFLSTGILTGYAGHLTLMFKKINSLAFVRSGGASGALFAMFGVFCAQFPHAEVGILFVPFRFEAINFLPCVMLFDFVGMVRGYSFINWGHAAHLSGALLGVGYSYLDGKTHIWNPLVKFWKRRLQKA